jgi:pimeloyl-ACP methyl ester carboxylesterase
MNLILAVFIGLSIFIINGCKENMKINDTFNIAKTDRLDVFYETFGNKEDQAILLIMGSGGQGVLWPTEFCKKLAGKKFYVIRYDLRDSGNSTCFDFEKTPYSFQDLAKDAIALLDFLKIEKADLVGLSMGAFIAELMSVNYPERVKTITLISATCDIRPIISTFKGFPTEKYDLSHPTKEYLKFVAEVSKTVPPVTLEEKIEQRIVIWNILNGPAKSLDKEEICKMHATYLERLKNPAALRNYRNAHILSEELVRTVPYKVNVPTLILHGSEDPIFTPEHGQALHKAIKGSKYYLLEGMGHILNQNFYDYIIDKIVETQKN